MIWQIRFDAECECNAAAQSVVRGQVVSQKA